MWAVCSGMTHTHLGKWWNEGRRCPMCPINKSVCSHTHSQSNTDEGQQCRSVMRTLTSTHTNTQYHDRANSTLCPFLACWPNQFLLPHLLNFPAPHLSIYKTICILRSPKHIILSSPCYTHTQTHPALCHIYACVNTDISVTYQAK